MLCQVGTGGNQAASHQMKMMAQADLQRETELQHQQACSLRVLNALTTCFQERAGCILGLIFKKIGSAALKEMASEALHNHFQALCAATSSKSAGKSPRKACSYATYTKKKSKLKPRNCNTKIRSLTL